MTEVGVREGEEYRRHLRHLGDSCDLLVDGCVLAGRGGSEGHFVEGLEGYDAVCPKDAAHVQVVAQEDARDSARPVGRLGLADRGGRRRKKVDQGAELAKLALELPLMSPVVRRVHVGVLDADVGRKEECLDSHERE